MKLRVKVISLAVAGMGAGAIAAAMLQPFEGREYHAYQDPVGIWSICDGATTGVVKGDFADDLDCNLMTARDVAIADATFERCAPGLRHAMPAYRRAAFIDFIYNVGPGKTGVKDGFCRLRNGRIPTIRWMLNNGDQLGACREFKFWNLQKLKGIAERREVEKLVCLGLIVEGAGHWHDWRRR